MVNWPILVLEVRYLCATPRHWQFVRFCLTAWMSVTYVTVPSVFDFPPTRTTSFPGFHHALLNSWR